MVQGHFDPLNAIDAGFLHQEGSTTHMHIGGVALFEGEVPDIGKLREHISRRLALVPRYRQKLAVPPAGLGRQRWVDDPNFNLEYHVRHTALPRPGDDERLHRLVARIFSQRLDRTKPLWELWVVEGLSGDRFALISKTHHALVDGMSGVDLMSMLFDVSETPREVEADDGWQPRPEPSAAELVAGGLGGALRRALDVPVQAASAVARPGAALSAAREAAAGIGELALAGLNPAPDTPLNVPIGPHRRFAGVPATLDEFRLVKRVLGGSVNDVVLAVVTGALRHWLHGRGVRTRALELRGAVPVSIRRREDQPSLGNQLAQVLAPLPVHVADPVDRLRHVTRAMAGIKESRQALGAEVIAGMQDFAPPTILAQASRLNFASRLYNLLVTNIPGPQLPLYVLGRALREVFPVAFLAGDRALAVAIMSYDGRIGFGLLADYDALPDLDVLADGVRLSIDELVAAAKAEGAHDGRRRTRPVR